MFVKTIGIFDVFVGATGYYINLPATSEFKFSEWLTLKEVEEFRARATASSIDHTVYVDTRCTDLLNMIENHIEELHSKPQIEEGSLEALREKVRTFKLLTEEKQ